MKKVSAFLGRTMAVPQLLVHEKKDTVGVVVVEGLKKGTDMLCVVTADNSSFKLKAKMDVPGQGGGTPASVTLTLTGFNDPVTITPPG
jgi:hypothetical protein